MIKCVSCGGTTTSKKLLGVCLKCQDYIISHRARELQEKIQPEYDRVNKIREDLVKEREDLHNSKIGLKLIKLLKEVI